MKRLTLTLAATATAATLAAQPVGYYNGTEGKRGDELKAALHQIISGHTSWEYSYAKDVMTLSDRDPQNAANVLLVYTGRSQAANTYGTGGDYINREHVWAKSHGAFGEAKPAGSDVHNLKPADGSVNVDRSNKDFDNCQAGGQQHAEATGCYYTADAWEPRDEVKGDIARIIFYMATRYEGGSGEPDLEVAESLNNSPQPLHGRLSALYGWNAQDAPDAFELNRNDVIERFQRNRNPYIDNPAWVDMIWGDAPAPAIAIGGMEQSPALPGPADAVTITATATGAGAVTATLHWGTSRMDLANQIDMQPAGGALAATIPAQAGGTNVYLKVVATDGTNTSQSVTYQYRVQPVYSGTITPIAEVQGQTALSPMQNQTVAVTGIVTGNFGDGYFVQDARAAWSGLYIYDPGRNPQVGDSLIVAGRITEYYELTEMSELTHYQVVASGLPLPEPITITAAEAREAYEAVLVRVAAAQVTSINEGYGLWKVNDGTGDLMVHNTMLHSHTPAMSAYYDIAAPLTYDYSEWKLELRGPDDVRPGTDTEKPRVEDLVQTAADYAWLYFSEAIDPASVGDLTNYQFSEPITVASATKHAIQPHVVILRFSVMAMGPHTATIQGVRDLAGNTMDPVTTTFFSSYVGTSDPDSNAQEQLQVYPNPVINGAISLDNARNVVTIKVFDITGRQIYQVDNPDRMQKVIIGSLPRGVLSIVGVTADGETIQEQIVVP